MPDPLSLTTGQCATLACLLEATAPKPGNVHRGADFDDVSYVDYVASAVAIAPAMENAVRTSVGQAVLAARRATAAVTRHNTNLGIVLLLAPLAQVPRQNPLPEGVSDALAALATADACDVYTAIREAHPGGLQPMDQQVNTMDVSGDAPESLMHAMRIAADRDLVARQYVTDFADLFTYVVPWLVEESSGPTLTERIIHAHLRLMALYPDTLIERKCGRKTAEQAAFRAGAVISAGEPSSVPYRQALADLDFWLRSDGHRRNPGTSADLIAAGLFVCLRDQLLTPPFV